MVKPSQVGRTDYTLPTKKPSRWLGFFIQANRSNQGRLCGLFKADKT